MMLRRCNFYGLAIFLPGIVLSGGVALPSTTLNSHSACRVLPGDSDWPHPEVWRKFNQTVGGRLIEGVPLGAPCYPPQFDQEACTKLQNDWTDLGQL